VQAPMVFRSQVEKPLRMFFAHHFYYENSMNKTSSCEGATSLTFVNIKRNKSKEVRVAERRRRRNIIRMIKARASELEGKYQGFVDVSRDWDSRDAAQSIEYAFGIQNGTTLRYFKSIEELAKFYWCFHWAPTRENIVHWQSILQGPKLP
jgi:hypothetical protein